MISSVGSPVIPSFMEPNTPSALAQNNTIMDMNLSMNSFSATPFSGGERTFSTPILALGTGGPSSNLGAPTKLNY